MIVYWLYSFFLTVAFIILCPYFLYQALKTGRHFGGLSQRLGYVPPIDHKIPIIWIHAVSVGETLAIQNLVEELLNHFAEMKLVISTVTTTGQTIARARFGDIAKIIYFPFDWKFCIRRTLKKINPALVLIVETELWPNFLYMCGQRRIPVILINGRLSPKSFNRYMLVRPMMKKVLSNLRLMLMQSEEDACRIIQLGATPDKVVVTGNLKLDVRPPKSEEIKAAELDRLLSLSATKHLVVAGSTASGEEEIILEAFRIMKNQSKRLKQARLIIAPRRPERFEEVEKTIIRSGIQYARRSAAAFGSIEHAEVILLDSVGELAATYRFAKVAVLGGSLCGSVQHNFFEAVQRGACVVVGKGCGFGGLFCLSLSDACLKTEIAKALANALQILLLDDETRNYLLSVAGANARTNQGASTRVIAHLKAILNQAPI